MSPSLHPRPLLRVVLPLLFIGLTSIATAQTWQRIALQGIAIGTLVRGGDGVLLASGPQSIYRSTDVGLTWESLLGIGGFRLMNGDRRLLVGVANTALAISADSGVTWATLRDQALRDSLGVLWSATVSQGNIYLGTTTAVLRSSDAGATWESRSDGLPPNTPHIGTLATLPDGRLVGGSQGILGGSIYLSNADVTSWTPIYTRPPFSEAEPNAVAVTAAGTIVAGVSKRGVIRTADEGTNWEDASITLAPNETIRTFVATDTDVFAIGSIGHLYQSTDDGRTWAEFSRLGLTQAGIQALLPMGGEHYLAGTASGIYETGRPSSVEVISAAGTVSISPIPSRDGSLTLRRDRIANAARYSVIDALGSIVRRGELPAGESTARVDGLASGSYLIRLTDERGATIVRATVTR